MGFQRVDGLLLVGDLLLKVIQLGFACGVAGIIRFRVDVILFQAEFTLHELEILLRFRKLFLQGGQFGGGFGFLVGVFGR